MSYYKAVERNKTIFPPFFYSAVPIAYLINLLKIYFLKILEIISAMEDRIYHYL